MDDASIRRSLSSLGKQLRTAIAAAFAAMQARTQRSIQTLSNLATGATDVDCVWATPFPNAGYMVIPTLISGTAALGTLSCTLKSGSKNTTDCTITVNNASGNVIASVGLDVLGIFA